MSSFCQAFQASSLMYLFLDQVRWFFKLVAQCKVWLATSVAHLVKPAILKHHATKQQIICLSSVSSVKLDVPFLDQVWWFFKVVAQCKPWLATTVAHLVKPATLKHHATKQQIICFSSVSSVKLDVPFSWLSVVVLQVGSTVQTMIGYHCGTSCEASDFETSCNKATNHMFIKRFKRQAWCTFFLTKCGGSSSW